VAPEALDCARPPVAVNEEEAPASAGAPGDVSRGSTLPAQPASAQADVMTSARQRGSVTGLAWRVRVAPRDGGTSKDGGASIHAGFPADEGAPANGGATHDAPDAGSDGSADRGHAALHAAQ
jgi:hypothetical protein